MDRVIEKKKGIRAVFRKKNIPYFLAGVFVIFVLWLLLRDKSSTLKVDATTVTIGDVRLGEFDDYVRVSGQVQPITVVQVSLLEGGVVEEKLIEEGSMVKKGDVLVRLSNNTLGLQILQSEADLAEQENFLRNTTVTMEQEKLDLEKQRLEYTIDTERKKRKYEQYRRLDEDGLVAHEEYLQAKEDYELAVKSLWSWSSPVRSRTPSTALSRSATWKRVWRVCAAASSSCARGSRTSTSNPLSTDSSAPST